VNDKDLKVLEPKARVGLVVVLTGKGKGKTTSAMGMVLRSVGHGLRVCVIQFIKGSLYSGEMDGLKGLPNPVEHHVMGKGFTGKRGTVPREEHRASAQEAVDLAKKRLLSGEIDVLICDEINNALKMGLVDLPQVLDLIDHKPDQTHLVLTGRNAHADVVSKAHTVSEIVEIKHACRQGIEPQKGIDY
jgi:cob(I)alamin adenosyltransferase